MKDNLFLALVINRFPGHRGWHKKGILDNCRDEKDLPHALEEYQRFCTTAVRKKHVDLQAIQKRVETEIRQLQYWNIKHRILGNADYPALLAEIVDPPLILYVRGTLPLCSGIAIVGTRRPSSAGRREAYKLAMEFALSGYPVVSGLAFGIDRSAHEGALAGGGLTWAVLAGGLDKPSPQSHRHLAEKILESGAALIGEIPPGEYPARYAFPRRNRILSGLCRGCIVVQAPEKSGALITADFALEQNRDLYVGSSGQSGLYAGGTRGLEAEGAPVVSDASNVLMDWGSWKNICRVRMLPAPDEQKTLVSLMRKELDGRIVHHAGAWFERCIA